MNETDDGPNIKLSSNRLAQNVATRITESLGLSWDEIESGQEQTGLGSFM